jgi:leucyl aminopeptidase
MIQFQIAPAKGGRKSADVVIAAYWQGKKGPIAAFDRKSIGEEFLSLMEKDFTGKPSEVLLSYSVDVIEKKVLLLGLGEKKECDLQVLRKAFAMATQLCRKHKIAHVNVLFPQDVAEDFLQGILDGFSMANYSFTALKKDTLEDALPVLKKATFFGVKKESQSRIDRQEKVMESVDLVRDLVNGNADDVKAQDLASIAKEIAQKHRSIQCKVLKNKELEKEKMGLILAVNRGSSQEAACIILSYQGDPSSKDVTAIVGKGITFDTGGLNLKPTGGIETMRVDMAGAAAVLGILQTAASLKIKKNIVGVIAAAENAIGSRSYKPGDVYISHSGKSVEISNTDAEGRLVLADALSYVQTHYAPSRIIDLATLTGGIVVAIGEEASGLFSNEKELTNQLQQAADITGERVWPMPLYPEYRKALKSTLADLKNSSAGRKASPCMGAIFLQQFIKKDVAWAHLDIAGTAYLSEQDPYYPTYATGVGVKLLTTFLENL